MYYPDAKSDVYKWIEAHLSLLDAHVWLIKCSTLGMRPRELGESLNYLFKRSGCDMEFLDPKLVDHYDFGDNVSVAVPFYTRDRYRCLEFDALQSSSHAELASLVRDLRSLDGVNDAQICYDFRRVSGLTVNVDMSGSGFIQPRLISRVYNTWRRCANLSSVLPLCLPKDIQSS